MKHHRFERDGIVSEVFLMDCMDGMKMYPEKYFDLACVDPPYGINVSKGTWGSSNKGKVTDYGKKYWDKHAPKQHYFLELNRVSKNQIVWGANHFISRMPFDSSCWLVWDKLNTGDFADCELACTSFDTAVRKFMWRWNGMLQQNMKNKEERIHPTQKPIALYDWIFKNYAQQGQKIIDTHLGSGSSRIAAETAGLHFVGFEIDEEYFNASIERFENHVKQPRLQLEVRELPEQKNLL